MGASNGKKAEVSWERPEAVDVRREATVEIKKAKGKKRKIVALECDS
jgi:hypothetical protein